MIGTSNVIVVGISLIVEGYCGIHGLDFECFSRCGWFCTVRVDECEDLWWV